MHRLTLTDVGCGYGASLRPLQQALETTTGPAALGHVNLVEVDPKRLAHAASLALSLGIEARTYCADIETGTSLLPEPADIVLFSMVILHLPGCHGAFSLAKRLVKPGGLVAIVDADYAGMRAGGDESLVATADYIRTAIRHNDQPTYDAVAAKHGLVKILTNDERWLFDDHGISAKEALSFVRLFQLPAVVDRWSSIRGGSLEITYLQRIYAAA